MDDLFVDDRKRELDGWLQTLSIVKHFFQKILRLIVKPSIYKVKELSDENFYGHLKDKVERNEEIT